MMKSKYVVLVFIMGILTSIIQTTTFCADIIVNSATKINLPAVGTAGRLYRVTDDVRGLWMDQGSQWFGLSGEIVNVKEFGAKGDGVTDDKMAIDTAIAAINSRSQKNGIVFFPPGRYKCSNSITLPGTSQGIILQGSGATNVDTNRTAWIIFDAGGFVINGLSGIWIRDLNIHTTAAAGPAISINSGADLYFERFVIYSSNTNQPIIKGITSLIRIVIRDFVFTLASGYAQPAIDLQAGGAALNNIWIEDGIINGNNTGTAPLIKFESTSGVSTSNAIRNVIFETPVSGAIHWFSVQRSRIEGGWAGDLLVSPTSPLIRIAKSPVAGSLPSQSITVIGFETDIGTAANPSFLMETNVASQGMATLIGCRFPFISNNGPGGSPLTVINDDDPTFIGDPPLRLRTNRLHSADIREIKGISATAIGATNIRDSLTISNTSTSGTVTFGTAEPDANYFITVTPTAITGSPATGSNLIKSISKTATGFTVTLDAAPGNGNSRTFDWHLIR